MNILISCLLIIGIGKLINGLIKGIDVKKKDNYYTNEADVEDDKDDAQMEKGFVDEKAPYSTGYSKNMFVESHYELGISLFERELTALMVMDAYEKVLSDHMKDIENGVLVDFNLDEKKASREYLLNYLNKSRTSSENK